MSMRPKSIHLIFFSLPLFGSLFVSLSFGFFSISLSSYTIVGEVEGARPA